MNNTIEYREKHPYCTFCKNACYQFMKLRCIKKPADRKISAKDCPSYEPTLEPIEKRSLRIN